MQSVLPIRMESRITTDRRRKFTTLFIVWDLIGNCDNGGGVDNIKAYNVIKWAIEVMINMQISNGINFSRSIERLMGFCFGET